MYGSDKHQIQDIDYSVSVMFIFLKRKENKSEANMGEC